MRDTQKLHSTLAKKLFPVVLICLSLIACSGEKWQLTDVSGHLPDLQFSLIDDDGKAVNEKNYQGQIVLLYFGYTGCGLECPLTLAKLKPILARLDNVRLLFVSVDPQNDTPEILHGFLKVYNSKYITGLTGTENEIEALAKKYRIAYRVNNGGHSSVIFIFDKQGKARLLASADDDDAKLVHDLEIISHD